MIESNRHNNFIFETLKDCDYQVFTFNKALKCLKGWDLDEDIPFEENLIYLTKEHINEFNIEAEREQGLNKWILWFNCVQYN